MLKIIDVDFKKDFLLELSFNNGESHLLNFKPLLKGSRYQPLSDPAFFKQFGIVNGTLEWVNGADFAPEYLHEQALLQNQKESIK
ncbi:MAG: DUF2442 domain-containing protein [Cyclobacteriaceae bacterium]